MVDRGSSDGRKSMSCLIIIAISRTWSIVRTATVHRCRDVFRFEVRVIGKDLFAGRAGGQKVEHILYSDAKFPDAGATTAHVRIHRDSVYQAHVLSAGQPAPNRPILALPQTLSVRIRPAVELVPPGAWPAYPTHGEGANV